MPESLRLRESEIMRRHDIAPRLDTHRRQHFGAIDFGALADALRERAALQAALRSALARVGCELLIYPSVPVVAPPLGHDVSISHNGRTVGAFETVIRHGDLAGTLGVPAVPIPAGLGPQSSLPVGLDIAALPDQTRGFSRRLSGSAP